MKRKFLAPVLGLIMVICLVQAAGAAFVPYSGAWETTDTQSSAYTYAFFGDLGSGWSFGVYDIAATNNPSSLALIDSANTSSTFNVNGNTLQVTQGMSNGSSLTLSSADGSFGFYFSDGSSDFYTYQYDSLGPENQWLLKMADSYSAGGPVFASDVNPVPISGALWLLGSGLLGLVAVRRRKAKA